MKTNLQIFREIAIEVFMIISISTFTYAVLRVNDPIFLLTKQITTDNCYLDISTNDVRQRVDNVFVTDIGWAKKVYLVCKYK